MENSNIFLVAKAVIVSICGAFGAAFGWLGWLVLAWVICMVVDYISGSAAAMQSGQWASAQARAGIWHKAGMIVVVIVAALADYVLALVVTNIPALPITYTVMILPVVLVWYILTELGSILENASVMGAPVPEFLTKLMAAAREKVDDVAAGDTSSKE